MATRLHLPALSRRTVKPETIEKRYAGSGYMAGDFNANYVNWAGERRPALNPTDELDAFGASEIIFACANLKATKFAGLDLAVVIDEEYEQDDITKRWNRASLDTDNAFIRKLLMAYLLEIAGECFIYMPRGKTTSAPPEDFIVVQKPVTPRFDTERIKTLDRKDPQFMRQLITPPLLGYRVQTAVGPVDVLPQEMLWLRHPHPTTPFGAMAPFFAALTAAELDQKAREWQAGELINNARPSGVTHLGNVSPEAAAAAKASFETRNGGAANAGRMIFTYGDTGNPGYTRIGLTPTEMSYLESHKVNGQDICVAMGVPVDLIFGQSTFDNQAAANARLWETLEAQTKLIDAEIDKQLYPDENKEARHDLREVDALKENEDSKVDRATKIWVSDGCSWQQYKEATGIEVVEGDERNDMIYTELQTASKPAPQPPVVMAPGENQPKPDPTQEVPAGDNPAPKADPSPAKDKAAPADEAAQRSVEIRAQIKRANAKYDMHERLVTQAVQRLARAQQKSVITKLDIHERKTSKALEKRAAGDDRVRPPEQPGAEELFPATYWAQQTYDALEGPLEGMWTDAALTTAEQIGSEVTPTFLARVLASMKDRLVTLAGQITETTRKVIEDELLTPGVEAARPLTERIKAKFEDLSTWRAESIARTEVVGGMNESSWITMDDSKVVAEHIWLETADARTRQSHQHQPIGVGGEQVPLKSRFSNGLRFPGDPTGKASEVIGCRCTTLAVLNSGES